MQDFQEVIEDSQLINAMYDDTPKPVEPWYVATADEVEVYESHVAHYTPEELSMPYICNTSLGFYLFTRFLRESGLVVYACFLVDAARYRSAPRSKLHRMARELSWKYLTSNTARSSSSGGFRKSNVKREENFPVSLSRNMKLSTPSETIKTNDVKEEEYNEDKEDFDSSSQDNIALSESRTPEWTEDLNSPTSNGLGITGPIVDKLIVAIESTLADNFVPSLFDELDGIVFSLVCRKESEFKKSPLYSKYVNVRIQLSRPVTLKDFHLFRTLGRGGFGLVNGCKKCQSGHLYAMKTLCRKRIKLKKATELCLNERSILKMIRSPFVVCMQYAFTTPLEVCMVFDLMMGGDLGFYLRRIGAFSPAETKYFVARTVLGLKALHDANVVYRDLKPENILLDSKGRSKISDLGLACVVPEKKGLAGTYGTRGYWAPEMLKRDLDGHRLRYRCEVDWFSLGCITYEFIVGVCPFKTDVARKWNSRGGRGAAGSSSTVSSSIRSTRSTKCKARSELEERIDAAVLEMEPDFSDPRFDSNSISFCKALLNKDGPSRLGYNGASEVMQHAFFSDINWGDIISDEMPPPSQPRRDLNMGTQDEIGTFSDAKLAKKIELTEEDMNVFSQWDYVRPEALYDEAVKFMLYEESHGKIIIKDSSGFCCTIL